MSDRERERDRKENEKSEEEEKKLSSLSSLTDSAAENAAAVSIPWYLRSVLL